MFRSRIFIGIVAYGVVIGVFSYSMGQGNDFAFRLNIPGIWASNLIYGELIKYWQSTMEPSGYEEIPIMDALTGERLGTETDPIYDLPLQDESALYVPISILAWGALSFGIAVLKRVSGRSRAKP